MTRDTTMELLPYRDVWDAEDPHANFKSEVASYTLADPLPTLEQLSESTGIPAGCLARYVLVKWAASGAEALISIGPIALAQMRRQVAAAEEAGTDAARLAAYESLRQMIEWLNAGAEAPG
jgi:hypothetical protein